jgi:ribosomal protein S6--L-glutamate ligase
MKIAILSRSPKTHSTARLIESAKHRGHKVVVIDHTRCTMKIEQDHPAVYYHGKEVTGVDAVIPRIGASVTFYGTAVVRQFEMQRIFSANESQSITRSRDKLRSLQLLSRAGIAVPKTMFANHSRNAEELIEGVGGAPVVIKLLEGTQGIGVILAETQQGAKSIIEAFLGQEIYILVQEFVAEAHGADIRAFVIDDKVVGAMERRGRGGEFRSNLHRGGRGRLIELTEAEKLAAIRATQILGLQIAGVDMIRSSRGSLILEVNSSPGLQGIEEATGVDIAGLIIEFVERNAPSKKVKDEVGF